MIVLSAFTREFLSHPIEEEPHSLLEHLITVANRSEQIFSKTKFNDSKIAFYSGLLHDIGKLNPFYQILFNETSNRRIKENELVGRYLKVHSPLSAWAADKLLSKDLGLDNDTISKIIILIYSHHSKLKRILGQISLGTAFNQSKMDMIPNLKEFARQASPRGEFSGLRWNECIKKFIYPIDFNICLKSAKSLALDSFLELQVAFSSLLQADRGSFGEYEESKFDIRIDTKKLVKEGNLAKLRTEFQNHVDENFDAAEPIVVINAPTGIGKTKVFLDLISKYVDDPDVERIFYFSPLLALTDDFERKLDESIPDKDNLNQILIYNHIFAGSVEEKNSLENGMPAQTKWSFPVESFNAKFVITTTQRLLMILYSNKHRDCLKLVSFRNSILIIDEVQTIPKYILANLKKILLKLNQYMGTKTILVSATIPHEISDVKKVKIPYDLIENYLKTTRKNILFEQLDLEKILPNRTLVMANTRKKAANLFLHLTSLNKNMETFYLSTGIIKKDRKKILEKITNKNDFVLVSTQVVEAGVDVSFSTIYREMAPLDSIVQVMGRLNREGANPDAKLVIYHSDGSHRPYSELEFNESEEQIKQVCDSVGLYSILGNYYEAIAKKNRLYANYLQELEYHVERMDFDKVWDFVNRHVFLDEGKDSVFLPDLSQWDEVKNALLNGMPRNAYRRFGNLVASLPSGANLDYAKYFDPVLLEKNILLPKKDLLDQVYDNKLGLDKWLVMD